ncbi:hypothetical protein PROFUN_13702 [Planoprotostelium fungivorum]|uniref:Uncharacterized protein n=1 Tax=Planoprotostelium fungivorum TaxID=1890364 RepID=A0A2P6N3A1_9EUKA|nr:hypothetical protein PROFUN_13702 [Planoprotostelium fungivorum]
MFLRGEGRYQSRHPSQSESLQNWSCIDWMIHREIGRTEQLTHLIVFSFSHEHRPEPSSYEIDEWNIRMGDQRAIEGNRPMRETSTWNAIRF